MAASMMSTILPSSGSSGASAASGAPLVRLWFLLLHELLLKLWNREPLIKEIRNREIEHAKS